MYSIENVNQDIPHLLSSGVLFDGNATICLGQGQREGRRERQQDCKVILGMGLEFQSGCRDSQWLSYIASQDLRWLTVSYTAGGSRCYLEQNIYIQICRWSLLGGGLLWWVWCKMLSWSPLLNVFCLVCSRNDEMSNCCNFNQNFSFQGA